MRKLVLLSILAFDILGCSTAAKITAHPKACEIGMDGAYSLNWAYWLSGVTIQQGNCALFPSLSFEPGLYYYHRKAKIYTDIESGAGINGRLEGSLGNFAYISGCRKEGMDLFIKKLHENRDWVFGPGFENWSRTVMLRMREMAETDPELAPFCR